MRYFVVVGAVAVVLAMIYLQPAATAGGDEVAKLRARVELLEKENKSLKDQIVKLMEQLAALKKPLAKNEITIDIDSIDDIRIGEKKHSLTSLRQLFESAKPSQVTVRQKTSTTIGLSSGMTAFMKKSGFTLDAELGNEQVWISSVSRK